MGQLKIRFSEQIDTPVIRLKNKPRAVIVVYDDDESIASKAATTLTQRGYENVFMLSGMKNTKLRIPSNNHL